MSDWKEFITLWQPVIAAIVLYVGIPMLQNWLAQQRWGKGAASFAGKAYIALMQARKEKPGTDLKILIADVVREQGLAFAKSYAETATRLGATQADADSRVKGALGDMLAKDPTLSVAPTETVTLQEVRNPPALAVPLRSA